jgi:predicted secreted protein
VQRALVLAEPDNGKTFDVQVGTPVTLRLPENPATGYRWSIAALDDALLSLEGSEFDQAPAAGVGGGGTRTIRLLPRAAGTAQLSLRNKRAWESDASAVGQFEVTLNISK